MARTPSTPGTAKNPSAGTEDGTTAGIARTSQSFPAVEGYPSLRTAARLIGVSTSTLSRRPDVDRVRVGREDRLPPSEVIRLAALYGRRRVSRVAGELVERVVGTDAQDDIAREVDEALALHAPAPAAPMPHAFLAEARRLLPAPLVAQIEAALGAPGGSGRSTVGWSPGGH
jgi:hypothetical protein